VYAEPDLRGQVDDGVDALEGARVADVSDDQARPWLRAVGVDIWAERVENGDLVALGKKLVVDVAADEAGSAGQQDSHQASSE